MDGANARFIAGKAAWLERHLIVYNVLKKGDSNPFDQGLGTANAELDVQEFDLRKIGGIHMNGGQGKEYELRWIDEWVGRAGPNQKAREKGSNTHPIRAYFLPWGSNRTFVGRLGNRADFFFTPTLNGCTFAYSDNGATPSVGHANFRDANDLADQNAVNMDLIRKFGAMPPNRLIKTDYKRQPTGTEDYRATVIGIRSGAGWRFYYQNYSVDYATVTQLVRSGLTMCQEI